MAQFYNDKINNELDKKLNVLLKSDVKLVELQYKEFIKFTETSRIITLIDYAEKFYKIYDSEIDLSQPFESQNSKNEKRISGQAGKEIKYIPTLQNSKKSIIEYGNRLSQLVENSYSKLIEMTRQYKMKMLELN